MRRTLNLWSRRLHRWGAIITLLPVGFIVLAGLVLQVKKQWTWVQPPTLRGSSPGEPGITIDAILNAARSAPEAGIETWADIERLDLQPGRGIVKVQARSSWEVQIDLATAEVLQVAYRRSDLIESLHDGSFFGEAVKLGVFLPSGVILFSLWLTGIWLWLMPHLAKRASRAARGKAAGAAAPPG